jgi:hypothetical protein
LIVLAFSNQIQPTTTTSSATAFDSLLLLLAAAQQSQPQQSFCQIGGIGGFQQTAQSSNTLSLDLLQQLQNAQNNQQQVLSPNHSVAATMSQVSQKPIITTVVSPVQQQPQLVTRGRPRRSNENTANASIVANQVAKPQKLELVKQEIGSKPQSQIRQPGRNPPTSSDSCSAIANYLMSFNKVTHFK